MRQSEQARSVCKPACHLAPVCLSECFFGFAVDLTTAHVFASCPNRLLTLTDTCSTSGHNCVFADGLVLRAFIAQGSSVLQPSRPVMLLVYE